MRFLICLRGEKLSRETLHFGATWASRLGTDITVLSVSPGVRRSFATEATIVRQKMDEWHMKSPGNEVLRAARDHLVGMGLIQEDDESSEQTQIMVRGADDSFELKRVGRGGERVVFRFREGDVVEEILAEMRARRHELLVIGAGPGRGGPMPQLLKFSPSSLLIVKNPRDIRYRVMVTTDGTPPAHRAELLGIKAASMFGMELTFLTVITKKTDPEFIKKHLDRMTGLCELKKVPHRVDMVAGNIVKETAAAAGDDHILFLGRSRRGTLRKVLLGSTAIRIAVAANCPMLVVK